MLIEPAPKLEATRIGLAHFGVDRRRHGREEASALFEFVPHVDHWRLRLYPNVILKSL
jgi:hypothetical protein